MKEEQLKTEQQTRERLIFASEALGKAILNSEPYQNFIKARDNFRVNDEAKQVSMEYNTVLRDYQMKANYGGLTPDDENKIEEARRKAMENKVLNDFYTSQEKLISFYQELNSYLSEKLKFNFASLAKPASSCCG
ncbi:MAG: YlbF family regulator [Ignavibacterium sp.]|uniref:YlbF family regulator n=1 Tax=Ignavibacterium sp. TaxID=2651167 RepID=UPI00404B88A8